MPHLYLPFTPGKIQNITTSYINCQFLFAYYNMQYTQSSWIINLTPNPISYIVNFRLGESGYIRAITTFTLISEKRISSYFEIYFTLNIGWKQKRRSMS